METSKKTDTYSVIMLAFGAVSLVVLIVLLFIDPLSFGVMLLLLATLGFILFYFGFVKVEKQPNLLDVTYTTMPIPEGNASETTALPSSEIQPRTLSGPEVFHISDNIFTYDEARAVCRAYDSELASYPQIEQAYNAGAEWCGYGWSEGGLALFPTQEATWEKLQKEQDPSKRIECGRPGINGGYFDASTKFGVNCYGIKPTQKLSDKKQMNAGDTAFNRLVGQIKDRIDKLLVSPFNSNEWSENRVRMPQIVSSETRVGTAQSVVDKSQTLLTGGVDVVEKTISGGSDVLGSVVSALKDVGTGITNVVKDII
jgi:hypothetical protein